MIKLQFFAFILRWLASSIGMYLCISWFGTVHPEATTAGEQGWLLYAIAGLIFSVINSVIKPLIKIMALPLAIVSMGISTLIINTAMVVATINLLPGVEMEGFWGPAASSIILAVINSALNFLIS